MGNRMTVDLSGKVAIITGASGVIGSSIALEYVRNGAKVVLVARSKEKLDVISEKIRKISGEAIVVPTDVSDKGQTEAMVQTTIEHFGRLDILINNAGVNGGVEDRKNFWEYSDELWERIMHVDLSSIYYCSKPAAKYMIAHKGGTIINIASTTGIVPLRLQCAYAAAKAGVIHLSKAMALELAEHNIRVNIIAPGSVITEQLKEVFYNDKDRAEGILSHIPQHRTGEPEDVAAAALFLASEDAAYITGQVQVIDGGWICGYTRNF